MCAVKLKLTTHICFEGPNSLEVKTIYTISLPKKYTYNQEF